MLAGLAAIVLLAFALRLAIGLLTPLDADESVEGIAALRILHGHLVLMESNARYLGALDSYLLAPFVAVFGPTLLAIRVALSVVGAGYVAGTFALGRRLFGSDRDGLLLAGIAAVFPLFALSYGIKARTYGVLLLLEVICLLGGLRPGRRVVRVARRPAGNSPRGPGHWIPAKRPSIGWPALLRGSPIALAAAIARLLQHSLTTVATDKPVLKFTVFANEICVAGSCLN